MRQSYFFLPAILFWGAAPLSADVTVKATYTSAGGTATSTVYLTQDRQRFEDGSGIKLIRQNDRQVIIEIDEPGKELGRDAAKGRRNLGDDDGR